MENAVSVRHVAAMGVLVAAVVWPLASAPGVAALGPQSAPALAVRPRPQEQQGQVLPTVHYEDAMRHSGKQLPFTATTRPAR